MYREGLAAISRAVGQLPSLRRGLPTIAFVTDAPYLACDSNGSGTYTMAVLRSIRSAGYGIHYIYVSPRNRVIRYTVTKELSRLVTMSVWGYLRFSRTNLSMSPGDWANALAVVMQRKLPESVRPFYLTHVEPRILDPLRLADSAAVSMSHGSVPLVCTSPAGLEFARRKLRQVQPDVVIADRPWMAEVLDGLGPTILKMVFAHDVLHERARSFAEYGIPLEDRVLDRESEARLLAKAQVVVAIQEEEARLLREILPNREVLTLPMPVILRECRSIQVPGRCLFVGSNHIQNVEGLRWILHRVWPKILESVPEAELRVCGDVCSRIEGTFPKVRFLGRVPDLDGEYSAAQVCLVPSLAGSGLKIKLVEALSFGRACVATRIGLQGLMALAGTAVALADTPDEFSDAMCRILKSPSIRRAMEEAARCYVSTHLTPEAVCQPFLERIARHIQARACLEPTPAATGGPRQGEA